MSPPSVFSYSFALPASLERSFELFSDPHSLNTLTPTWFDLQPLRAVSGDLEIDMEISYRLRWRGLPMRWISRIVEFEPPHLLTYEQARGPYLAFRHEHRFRASSNATEVEDQVEYRTRGGALIDRLLVRPDLERIFRFRFRAARDLLERSHGLPAPSNATSGSLPARG